MKAITLRSAVYVIAADNAVSVFRDGRTNTMPLSLPSHRDHAPAAGYGSDGRRYIIEHDLIHHMLADWRGHPYSLALHANSAVPLDEATEDVKLEEHLVQRTQRLMNLGEPDPWDLLRATFQDQLRLWIAGCAERMDIELGPMPRHITGDRRDPTGIDR